MRIIITTNGGVKLANREIACLDHPDRFTTDFADFSGEKMF
jgi:hypothetical protein